jgi:DNA-binding transcriptional LysR family regulator
LETRFLETFVAVAERGSVAAAARAQGLTATSVAQRLQALEEELAVALVTRIGRETKVTPIGDRLLEQSRRILEEVRALKADASASVSDALVGTLRVGAISTVLTGLLPNVIGRWAEEHPALDLKISPGSSALLHEGLMDGHYDVVISAAPPFVLPKTVRSHLLRVEPLICLFPGHLAGGGADPEEDIRRILETERFIRYDALSWGGRLCDAYLRDKRIPTRELCSLDALEAIALLVERGVGATLVPDWAPPWPDVPSCRKVVVADPAYARRIMLTHPAKTRYGHIIEALMRALASDTPASPPAGTTLSRTSPSRPQAQRV